MLSILVNSFPFFATIVTVKLFQRIGLIKASHKDAIVALAFNIVVPALIILLMQDAKFSFGDSKYFVIALITWLLTWAVAAGLAKLLKFNRKMTGSLIMAFLTFGVGLIAYPLVELNFPPEAFVNLVIYDVTGIFLLMMTGTYLVATHYGENNQASVLDNLKTMVRSPIVIAMGIGLLFSIFGISHPLLTNTLEYISGAFGMTMSALLALTISLPKFSDIKILALSTIAKISIGLIAAIFATKLFSVTGDARAVIFIANASSTGLISVIFSEAEGLETEFVSQLALFSLLVSMVLAPILIALV